jgi:predicted phosphodiesterase
MTRREFLASLAAAPLMRHVPLAVAGPAKPLRLAVITDLHHGLAPDALSRLDAFAKAVLARGHLDAVVQMGDYCYSQPSSKECVDLFATMPQRKIHVLGNHDMDKVDKAGAMAYFGMKSRYRSQVLGGYRFVVLDLNHFKKGGKLFPYSNGNYYTDGAECNWADPEQLDWLGRELRASRQPVIIICHQPLGFAEPGQPMPAEQVAVMDVIESARSANPAGAVVACLFGHLHVDRLERCRDIPCLCLNSASYFWYQGMHAYTRPLFSFITISDGVMHVEGVHGEFKAPPPAASDAVIGRSASISDRSLEFRAALSRPRRAGWQSELG